MHSVIVNILRGKQLAFQTNNLQGGLRDLAEKRRHHALVEAPETLCSENLSQHISSAHLASR